MIVPYDWVGQDIYIQLKLLLGFFGCIIALLLCMVLFYFYLLIHPSIHPSICIDLIKPFHSTPTNSTYLEYLNKIDSLYFHTKFLSTPSFFGFGIGLFVNSSDSAHNARFLIASAQLFL